MWSNYTFFQGFVLLNHSDSTKWKIGKPATCKPGKRPSNKMLKLSPFDYCEKYNKYILDHGWKGYEKQAKMKVCAGDVCVRGVLSPERRELELELLVLRSRLSKLRARVRVDGDVGGATRVRSWLGAGAGAVHARGVCAAAHACLGAV